MKVFQSILIFISLIALVPQSTQATGVIVPAYFPWWRRSGIEDYQKLVKFSEIAEPNKLVVVINPNNGPWKAEWSFTTNMRNFAEEIRKNYQHPIGYVYTSYGARPIEQVQQDMRTYMDIYGIKAISGFFLDEVSSDPLTNDYYHTIIEYGNSLLKSRSFCSQNFGIILNAGTINDNIQELTDKGDLTVIKEMTEHDFLADVIPALRFPEKSAGLIYSCSNWDAVDDKIRTNKMGFYYCTDRTFGNNPWLSLPSHWEDSSLIVLGN